MAAAGRDIPHFNLKDRWENYPGGLNWTHLHISDHDLKSFFKLKERLWYLSSYQTRILKLQLWLNSKLSDGWPYHAIVYLLNTVHSFFHILLLQVSFKMEPYDLIVNQPVVIDNGSGVIKAGFAGDQVLCFWVEPEVTSFTVGASKPRIIFHCVFGNSVKRLAEYLS